MALQTQAIKRVFKYGAITLEDPGMVYTPEQVKDFYTNTYSDLTNAAVEGPEEKDGDNVYTFRKAVGTKGAGSKQSRLKDEFAKAVEFARQELLKGKLNDVGAINGVHMIGLERQRQILEEGYNARHDDNHRDGSLALAAACYASTLAAFAEQGASKTIYADVQPPFRWPWETRFWKPRDPIRDLSRAGALIAAEIDRLLRLQAKGAQ